MIQSLDHIALRVDDLDTAVAGYEVLLGRKSDWRGHDDCDHAWFRLANMALGLFAAAGQRPVAGWFAGGAGVSGQGPAGLAFRVAGMDEARRLLERRGIGSSPPRIVQAVQSETGAIQDILVAWLAAEATHGVAIAVAQPLGAGDPPDEASRDVGADPSAISALDHVVIRSANPERAIALLAGRLDLELRLDRTNPDSGARLLFFRCSDLVVEVAHDLKTGVTDNPDTLWGLSWRTPNLDAAHARLSAAGVEISEIRNGRRPGRGSSPSAIAAHACRRSSSVARRVIDR